MISQTILRAVKRAHLTFLTLIAVATLLSAASPAQAQFLAPDWSVKTDCLFKIVRKSDGKKKTTVLERQSESYFSGKDLIIRFQASYFDGETPTPGYIVVADAKTKKIYDQWDVTLTKEMDFELATSTPYGPVSITCRYF